jgi:hypothetical protein
VETLPVYDNPSIVNRPLPNSLAPKKKSGYLVIGMWSFNTNLFIDDDLLFAAMTDR